MMRMNYCALCASLRFSLLLFYSHTAILHMGLSFSTERSRQGLRFSSSPVHRQCSTPLRVPPVPPFLLCF